MRSAATEPHAGVAPGFQDQRRLYLGPSTQVFRAIRGSDGLSVILKATVETHPRPEQLQALEREHQLLSSLEDAQHVIGALDLLAVGHRYVLVLEGMGGISVRDLLGTRVLTLQQALSFAIDTLRGLDELHRARIIHRDINPSNLIVAPISGRVKICDLGLATRLQQLGELKPAEVLDGPLGRCNRGRSTGSRNQGDSQGSRRSPTVGERLRVLQEQAVPVPRARARGTGQSAPVSALQRRPDRGLDAPRGELGETGAPGAIVVGEPRTEPLCGPFTTALALGAECLGDLWERAGWSVDVESAAQVLGLQGLPRPGEPPQPSGRSPSQGDAAVAASPRGTVEVDHAPTPGRIGDPVGVWGREAVEDPDRSVGAPSAGTLCWLSLVPPRLEASSVVGSPLAGAGCIGQAQRLLQQDLCGVCEPPGQQQVGSAQVGLRFALDTLRHRGKGEHGQLRLWISIER